MSRDDRTSLDLQRDNIQNFKRLHWEISHRFKCSVDGRQFSLNVAGSTITLAVILHKNTMRARDLPQIELSEFDGSFIRWIIEAQYYGKIGSLLCLGISNGIIDDMEGRWFKAAIFSATFRQKCDN